VDPLLLLLALPIGILVGLGASLVGLTAWPLVVPVLLIVGYSPQESILTSLVIDLVNALIVTSFYQTRTSLGFDPALSVRLGILAVIPAAAAAVIVFPILGLYAEAFKGGSGIINLVLGSLFVIQAFRTKEDSEERADAERHTNRRFIVYVFCLVQGLVTGIIGIGGAMNIVIVLLIATSLRTRRAVGTAVAATTILLAGMVSVYLVLFSFIVPTLDIIVLITLVASTACVLGLLKSERISERWLRLTIGLVVLAAAVFSITQAVLLL
jgi:uncharacterized membrane protein YfcA